MFDCPATCAQRDDMFAEIRSLPGCAEKLRSNLSMADSSIKVLRFVSDDIWGSSGRCLMVSPCIAAFLVKSWDVRNACKHSGAVLPPLSAPLCRLPAAADISSADVASLLQAAFLIMHIRSRAGTGIKHLMYGLPAFSQLNSTEVAQLLRAGAQRCCNGAFAYAFADAFTSLCGLPAAQHLSTEQVLQPLEVVVPHNARCTKALCQLPAAQQLSSEAVAQLLQAAVKARSLQCFEVLSSLAAAQQLSIKSVVQLLEAAVEARSIVGMLFTVTLPAAAQLSSGHVSQALGAALACPKHCHSDSCVAQICQLPAAAMLSSDQVATALEAGM
ncbi:hypothetical protein COO60DRAFT_1511392 [Scenedesmus sp. NREL 46B-D3]|nr:hypothetical protein COO60DRAFT_1511392 [Scenedesmus sp. NREL 46B-D3]